MNQTTLGLMNEFNILFLILRLWYIIIACLWTLIDQSVWNNGFNPKYVP